MCLLKSYDLRLVNNYTKSDTASWPVLQRTDENRKSILHASRDGSRAMPSQPVVLAPSHQRRDGGGESCANSTKQTTGGNFYG